MVGEQINGRLPHKCPRGGATSVRLGGYTVSNADTSAPKWSTPATVSGRFAIWVFVGYSLWQGSGIVMGGSGRWVGPAYTFLRKAPGAPASWGWALITFGLLLGTASLLTLWRLKLVALAGISIWSLGFSVGAQYATSTVPTAGTTGSPAYFLICILAAGLIPYDESRKAT